MSIPFSSSSVALCSRSNLTRPLTFKEMDLLFHSIYRGFDFCNELIFDSSSIANNDILIDFARVDTAFIQSIDMSVNANIFSISFSIIDRIKYDFTPHFKEFDYNLYFKVSSGASSVLIVPQESSPFVIEFVSRIDDVTGDTIFSVKILGSSIDLNMFPHGFIFGSSFVDPSPYFFDMTLPTTLVPHV